MSDVRIRFDGPPGPTSGRFIETEDSQGRSISAGGWTQDGDDWLLELDIDALARKAGYVKIIDGSFYRKRIARALEQVGYGAEDVLDVIVRADREEDTDE